MPQLAPGSFGQPIPGFGGEPNTPTDPQPDSGRVLCAVQNQRQARLEIVSHQPVALAVFADAEGALPAPEDRTRALNGQDCFARNPA